ncbi:hypothetical protein [Thermoactinospora rubra]|nr:hypothetical protein [Thermoactinospora rubra]
MDSGPRRRPDGEVIETRTVPWIPAPHRVEYALSRDGRGKAIAGTATG